MVRFAKIEISACDEVMLPIRPLRRYELEMLLRFGVIQDERLELLDGALVPLRPIGNQHTLVGARLAGMLQRQLGPAWTVLRHCYLGLDEHSMPEPDVVVVPMPRPIDLRSPITIRPLTDQSPVPLVVEISDFTFQTDSIVKAMLYAEAGVPTYWLVDLVKRAVRVHERPIAGHFTAVETLGLEAVLTARELPAVALPVGEILAPP